MKALVLTPLLEEPPVLEDVVHTWTIDNWRSLEKKEHGPIFQAGGFPWYVLACFPTNRRAAPRCRAGGVHPVG